MEIEDLQSIARKNPITMTPKEVYAIYYTNYLRDHNDEEKARKAAENLTNRFINARNRRIEKPKEYRTAREALIEEIGRATDNPETYLKLH